MEFVRRIGGDDRINPGTWVGGYLDEYSPEGEDEGHRCACSECHRKYETSLNGMAGLLIAFILASDGGVTYDQALWLGESSERICW